MGKQKRRERAEPTPLPPKGNKIPPPSPEELKALDRAEAPLGDALEVFKRGDFVEAARRFSAHADDTSRSVEERTRARELLSTTRPERVALLAGAACVGLMTLIGVALAITQP